MALDNISKAFNEFLVGDKVGATTSSSISPFGMETVGILNKGIDEITNNVVGMYEQRKKMDLDRIQLEQSNYMIDVTRRAEADPSLTLAQGYFDEVNGKMQEYTKAIKENNLLNPKERENYLLQDTATKAQFNFNLKAINKKETERVVVNEHMDNQTELIKGLDESRNLEEYGLMQKQVKPILDNVTYMEQQGIIGGEQANGLRENIRNSILNNNKRIVLNQYDTDIKNSLEKSNLEDTVDKDGKIITEGFLTKKDKIKKQYEEMGKKGELDNLSKATGMSLDELSRYFDERATQLAGNVIMNYVQRNKDTNNKSITDIMKGAGSDDDKMKLVSAFSKKNKDTVINLLTRAGKKSDEIKNITDDIDDSLSEEVVNQERINIFDYGIKKMTEYNNKARTFATAQEGNQYLDTAKNDLMVELTKRDNKFIDGLFMGGLNINPNINKNIGAQIGAILSIAQTIPTKESKIPNDEWGTRGQNETSNQLARLDVETADYVNKNTVGLDFIVNSSDNRAKGKTTIDSDEKTNDLNGVSLAKKKAVNLLGAKGKDGNFVSVDAMQYYGKSFLKLANFNFMSDEVLSKADKGQIDASKPPVFAVNPNGTLGFARQITYGNGKKFSTSGANYHNNLATDLRIDSFADTLASGGVNNTAMNQIINSKGAMSVWLNMIMNPDTDVSSMPTANSINALYEFREKISDSKDSSLSSDNLDKITASFFAKRVKNLNEDFFKLALSIRNTPDSKEDSKLLANLLVRGAGETNAETLARKSKIGDLESGMTGIKGFVNAGKESFGLIKAYYENKANSSQNTNPLFEQAINMLANVVTKDSPYYDKRDVYAPPLFRIIKKLSSDAVPVKISGDKNINPIFIYGLNGKKQDVTEDRLRELVAKKYMVDNYNYKLKTGKNLYNMKEIEMLTARGNKYDTEKLGKDNTKIVIHYNYNGKQIPIQTDYSGLLHYEAQYNNLSQGMKAKMSSNPFTQIKNNK